MAEKFAWFDPAALVRLLTTQRDLYRRLRALSEQQREIISGDRPERLLGLLTERQALVARLGEVNEQLAPCRREWERLYRELADEARQQVTALLDDINGSLRAVLSADREDADLLAARKESLARSLDALSGARTANAAYARQSGDSPGGLSADVTG